MAAPASAARTEWGAAADMSEWEGLMWRIEADPRTRSSGALVEILDCEPDGERLVAAHERVTAAIPRLRDKVVEPLLPLVPPAFSRDEQFHIGNHLSRIRLATGTMRELLDFAAGFLTRPFAPGRPPWESVLVDGLEGGRSAYLLRMHHSLTDGQGLVQLLGIAHSRTREPGLRTEPAPPPSGQHLTPVSLLASRLARRVIETPGRVLEGAGRSVALATRTVSRPASVVGQGVRFARSLRRVLTPPPAKRSPLLAGSGSRCRFAVLEVPLADLKAAGKAAGGSVNDTFLAALLGGFAATTNTSPPRSTCCPWPYPSACAWPTTRPAGTASPVPASPPRWVRRIPGSASAPSGSSSSTPGPNRPSESSTCWLRPWPACPGRW